MLDNLKLLNATVGLMTPDMLLALTPAELNYMLAGGAQRSLNAATDQIMANQVTVPVVMVDDSSGDQDLIDRLKQRQARITDLTAPKEHQSKKDEIQQFAKMFVFGKKGGSNK